MIYHTTDTSDSTADYNSFRDLAKTVRASVEKIAPHVADFDSIIVTGVSGAAVGFPVALALGVPIAVLRKGTEDTHGSPGEIVGRGDLGERVLFLDDFVSQGTTRATVIRAVEKRKQYTPDFRKLEEVETGVKVVATFVYRDMEYRPS